MTRARASLEGLSVVVTGAASGIGRQVARDLCVREKCRVHLVDRDEAGLRSVVGEILREAPTGTPPPPYCVTDISSPESVAKMGEALGGRSVDLLVNCAGILAAGPFEHSRVEDFANVIQVNLLGTVRVTRLLLPQLLESPRGFIVNVASAAAFFGSPYLGAYSASKFGLLGFSQSLRVELDGRVGVCVVCPSLVRSRLVENAAFARTGQERGGMESILQRFGASPEKVSRAICGAVRGRKRLVTVNADAWLLSILSRYFPMLTEFIVRKGYRRLIRKGVLLE